MPLSPDEEALLAGQAQQELDEQHQLMLATLLVSASRRPLIPEELEWLARELGCFDVFIWLYNSGGQHAEGR